jgi:hypothetical protein
LLSTFNFLLSKSKFKAKKHPKPQLFQFGFYFLLSNQRFKKNAQRVPRILHFFLVLVSNPKKKSKKSVLRSIFQQGQKKSVLRSIFLHTLVKKCAACPPYFRLFSCSCEQPEKEVTKIRPAEHFPAGSKKNPPYGRLLYTQTFKNQEKSALRAAPLYTDFQKSRKIRPTGGSFIHRLSKITKNPPYGRLLYTQTFKNHKKSALRAAPLYTDFQKSRKIRPTGGSFIHRLSKITKNPPYGRLLYTQTFKNQEKSALRAAPLYTDFQKSRKIRPTGGSFIHRLSKITKNPPYGRLLYTQTFKNHEKSALRAAPLYTDFQKSRKIRPTGGSFIHRLSKNRKKSALRAAPSYTDFKTSKKIRPPGGSFIHRLQKIKKNPPSGRLLYTQTSKNQKKSALRKAPSYTDFKKSKQNRPPGGSFIHRLQKVMSCKFSLGTSLNFYYLE